MSNKHEKALICRLLAQQSKNGSKSQRLIAQALGFSLGKTNKLLAEMSSENLIERPDGIYRLSRIGQDFLDSFKVDNAIILAAGFGSRFVPFTYETPKGLLKVKGTPMVERQIEQLKACGIDEIIVVVGYLKEAFEYLIDKYGVKLVFNPEYAQKNNFVSLYYALDYLKNSYLLVADNWIEDNIFSRWEPRSWLTCLFFEGKTAEWAAFGTKQERITRLEIGGEDTWAIVGPAFFTQEFSEQFAPLVQQHYNKMGTDNDYWEHILKSNLQLLPPVYMNKQAQSNVYEFESLEELRLYDDSYTSNSKNNIMREIAHTFNVLENQICEIEPLKAGVTNYSFLFSIGNDKYVFRTPGIETEKLINRRQEKTVYDKIKFLHISDEIVSFNAERGTKISKFYPDVHVVNVTKANELNEAARLIRSVHNQKLQISHSFDIEKRISNYRSLAEEAHAIRFNDFFDVEKKMEELFVFKNRLNVSQVLCHGDYANTNVLIFPDGSGKIIDWEYSGMADPVMDIAMFAIYSYFERDEIEHFFRLYCIEEPSHEQWARLYLYVALGGFLWCIWAEYKQAGGQEFGEYPLIMYRYAKDFYEILKSEGYLDK